MTEQDELQLAQLAESVVIKGVQSPERLLDETSLFLHLLTTELAPAKQQMLERLRHSDEALRGKTVLIVDDDVRNIFALTSLLEQHGVRVISAETGKEAISLLDREEVIDAVLMDIMMPDMDGYETMGLIRKSTKHKLLPILALTAKAMKGDREKCLEAGASDYIAKPVNTEELLGLLRIWLFGKQTNSGVGYERTTANILVVDDDVKTLAAMEALLAGPGRNISTASSGTEALRLLLKADFALILMDVRLPVMDGFETAALIR